MKWLGESAATEPRRPRIWESIPARFSATWKKRPIDWVPLPPPKNRNRMRPAPRSRPSRADSDVTIESHSDDPVGSFGCKALKLQRFSTRPLARGLLPKGWKYAALMLLVSSGCLIPQESRILEPVPAVRNKPPRILEELVTPPPVIPTPPVRGGPFPPPRDRKSTHLKSPHTFNS